MRQVAVSIRDMAFKKPSELTLNVGAPTFSEMRRLGAAFDSQGVATKFRLRNLGCDHKRGSKGSALQNKPSETTLNVGAPTFFLAALPWLAAGSERYAPFVIADLQAGSSLFALPGTAGLNTGHYTRLASRPLAVAQ
jgi:hypothetical protein